MLSVPITVAPVLRAMYGMSSVWLKCECECRITSARVTCASTASVSDTSSSSGPNTRLTSPGTDGVVYVPNWPVMRSRDRYGSRRITCSPSVITQPAAPRWVSVSAARRAARGRALTGAYAYCTPIVCATSTGRSAPSSSTVMSEVTRTPPFSSSSTLAIRWRRRIREPAGTTPV